MESGENVFPLWLRTALVRVNAGPRSRGLNRSVATALLGLAAFAGGCVSSPGARAGRAWSVPLSETVSLPMIWAPAGTFVMGSPESEPERKTDEGPQTTVTLSKGFWLGTNLVTIGQWRAVTGRGLREQRVFTGARNPDQGMGSQDDDVPMYYISWTDAMDFCQALTVREKAAGRLPDGYEYTLPTEAQWEYACRAGTTTATYAGPATPEVLEKIAWYLPTAGVGYTGPGFTVGGVLRGPRKVGGKAPNPWGFHDMAGNIWEWCADYWSPSLPGGSVADPTGPATAYAGPATAALPSTGVRNGRVNRGGSFGSAGNRERSANRASNPQTETSAYRGFRLALAPLKRTAA